MTPIIEQQKQDTILTKDITCKHLIVAVLYNKPCILGKGYYEGDEDLSFLILNNAGKNNITTGNGHSFTSKQYNPQLMVEEVMNRGYKVAVYEQEDWRDALKWLMDNV